MKKRGDEFVTCGCINPNACDCLGGGISVLLQSQLQELHEQSGNASDDLMISELGVANLASLDKPRGKKEVAYF